MTDQTPNLPIPPGTRDVLPDEMRELRRVESSLRDTFDRFGYGEVATPAIEYDEVLTREDANAETREILGRVADLLSKYE